MKLRPFLRRPLVLVVAVLFSVVALYAVLVPPAAIAPGSRITVSRADIAGLTSEYGMTHSMPPSRTEMALMVDAEVRNRIVYREGRRLGLDRDDPVVERRVRDKYEQRVIEAAGVAMPTEAELAAFLASHPTRFRPPPLVAFDQVLIEPGRDPETLPLRVATARSALAAGADPRRLGTSRRLPGRIDLSELEFVARDFGDRFADAAAAAPIGQWGPPVRSGYGIHLIRVTERQQPPLPPLADIREDVAREWANAARETAREADYQRLRRRYDVVIE